MCRVIISFHEHRKDIQSHSDMRLEVDLYKKCLVLHQLRDIVKR